MCGVPSVVISLGFGAVVVREDTSGEAGEIVSGAAGIAEQALRIIVPRSNTRKFFCTSNLRSLEAESDFRQRRAPLMGMTKDASQWFQHICVSGG